LPKFLKILVVLLIISPVPAAMTGDSFYPLRALDLIWVISLLISIGVFYIINFSISNKITALPIFGFIIYLLFSFYVSYFVLFKYERAKDYGYVYLPLLKHLENYKNYRIIIDPTIDYGIGLRIAYLKSFDPNKMQKQLIPQMKTYYYSAEINDTETYRIDNIEVNKIDWNEACSDNTIIVGDILSVSEPQAIYHNLKYEFEIKDLTGDRGLRVYSTNPTKEKCGGS
jgi:hypothetical protein